MPGTLVSDLLEANLLAGATLTAGTTSGTIVQIDRPGEVAIVLETATVTGTTPTLSVVIQGSDSLTFASGVVTYGTITLLTGAAAAQSNVAKQISAHVYLQYIRVTITLAGTSPVYTGATIKVKQPHWRRTRAASAGV